MIKDVSLQTTRKKSYWIHSIIVVLFMFGFGHLPAADPLTPLGMQVLGIFIGMVYGWLFCGQVWPSILGLIALGFTDYCTVYQAISTGIGNNTVLLVLFMQAVAVVLDQAGITKWVAYKMVQARITKGRPWVLTWAIWLATIVLASALSIGGVLIIMWDIIYRITEVVGMKKGDKWPAVMLFSTSYLGGCAFVLFPFKAMSASALGPYAEVSNGATIPFGPFFLWQLMVLVVSAILFFLFIRIFIKPDVTKIAEANTVLDGTVEDLTNYQKFVMGYFICTIILMLAPSFMPKAWAITGMLNNLGMVGIAFLAIGGILFCGFKQGPQLKDLLGTRIVWDLIFLLMGAMTIAGAMTDSSTGINDWMISLLMPVMNNTSGIGLMLIVLIGIGLITQVSNNMTTAAMFTPIAYNLAVASGNINIPALILCLIGVANCALALPSGSAPAAMMWGNSEWIKSKTILSFGIIAAVINLAVCLCLGVPVALLMFS